MKKNILSKRSLLGLIAAPLISFTGFGQIPTAGLIAEYTFNDQNYLDESGNGNHAVANNVVTTEDRFGNLEYASYFSGSNSWLTLPNSLLLQNEITISLWVKPITDGIIIGQQSSALPNSTSAFVPILYVNNQYNLNAYLWDGTTGNIASSNLSMTVGAWRHLVITGDQNGQTIYVDGVNQGQGAAPNISNIGSLIHNQIGSGVSGGSWNNAPSGQYSFKGTIDDVRIYNRAIAAGEVQQLYNESDPDPIGLMAKYSFNSQNTLDESGNSNHATENSTTYVEDRFGNPQSALAFNDSLSVLDLQTNLLNFTEKITISMWFKTNSNGTLITQQAEPYTAASASTRVPMLYIRNDGQLNAKLWDGSTGNTNSSTTNFSDNEWHHVVLTGDANSQDVFVDNVSVGQGGGYTRLANATYNHIGQGKAGGSWPSSNYDFPFTGVIDDVAIFSKRYTANQVDSLYYEPNPALSASLEESEEKIVSINAIPNPTNGTFKVQNSEGFTFENLILYNSLGEILRTTNSGSMDISDLTPGIYFCKVINSDTFITVPVRKE